MVVTVIGYNDFKTLTTLFGSPSQVVYACGFGGSSTTVKVATAFYPDSQVVKITMNAPVADSLFIADFPAAVLMENMLTFS